MNLSIMSEDVESRFALNMALTVLAKMALVSFICNVCLVQPIFFTSRILTPA